MKFKISETITPKSEVPVPITHPASGEPTGITIHLHGRYTDGWRAAQKAFRAATGETKASDDAALADELRPFLAHATSGWEGVTDESDAPVACTPELARELYESVPWLYEQVFSAFLDTARFFGDGRTPSSSTRRTSSRSTKS